MERAVSSDPPDRSYNGSMIEFVGLPGAGKSTLAARVIDQLNAHNFSVRSPVAAINDRAAPVRILSKLSHVGMTGIFSPKVTFNSLRATGFGRLGSSSDARSTLFNWLFVHALVARRRRTERLVILDQGLFQAYWSACLSEPAALRATIRDEVVQIYRDRPLLIVDVQASPEILADRLSDREPNPSRVKPDRDAGYGIADATRAYSETRELIDDVIVHNPRAELLELSNETPAEIQPNVKKVSDRIRDQS